MKVAVGLRRVAAGKRTSGRRAAQIAYTGSILRDNIITDNNIVKYLFNICFSSYFFSFNKLHTLMYR